MSLRCNILQFVRSPWQGVDIVFVFVSVDTLPKDPNHETRVHQHHEAGRRGVELGEEVGVAGNFIFRIRIFSLVRSKLINLM